MPTLRVELFEGRTEAKKAELAQALTDACVAVLGSSPDSVEVLFYDIARRNWATGGVLWSQRIAAPESTSTPAPEPTPAPAPGGRPES